MNPKHNIKEPDKFKEKLENAMAAIYELLELSKEYDIKSALGDELIPYIEETGKTCFHVSGQFYRPNEYLQALLDIIRVNYEPRPMGTLLLNSNMQFIYDRIPSCPFRIGYVSITSCDNIPFDIFWKQYVVPYIKKCGYSFNNANPMYVITTVGVERYNTELMDNVISAIEPNLSFEAGFCLDAALEKKTRVSLWMFINDSSNETTT